LSEATAALSGSQVNSSQEFSASHPQISQLEANYHQQQRCYDALLNTIATMNADIQVINDLAQPDHSSHANPQTEIIALKQKLNLVKQFFAQYKEVVQVTDQLKTELGNISSTGIELPSEQKNKVNNAIKAVESLYSQSAVVELQHLLADLEEGVARLPELSSDIVTPTANTVTPPALDSITPATRTSRKNWFQRLSTTEKVFAAPAIAVAALAGASVVSALIFAHKAITAPISWPMLIGKIAGISNYENLRNNKTLCTLLGPNVVNALTSASGKKALATLTLEMGFVAACIATSGIASLALVATMLVTASAAGATFICDEATSWADLAESNTRRSVFPTDDNSPSPSPLAPV
jgi:hypothetical protein